MITIQEAYETALKLYADGEPQGSCECWPSYDEARRFYIWIEARKIGECLGIDGELFEAFAHAEYLKAYPPSNAAKGLLVACFIVAAIGALGFLLGMH